MGIKIKHVNSFLLILAVFGIVSGCSEVQSRPRIVWPPTPEIPKVEFVGVYSSKRDFPRTSLEKMVDNFVGDIPLALNHPFGILSDAEGRVLIADRDDKVVKIFDFNKRKITVIPSTIGIGMPLGMSFDGNGRLYVVDGKNRKIHVFSNEYELLFSIESEEDSFSPSYVVVDDQLNLVYVSEGRNHRVSVFDLEGNYLFRIGQPGVADGQFFVPQGLAIDNESRLFVADMLNSRIQVFLPNGDFLYSFSVAGDPAHPFENPKDLAFADNNDLYVVDQRQAALISYSKAGDMKFILGGNKRTAHPLGFAAPVSIHIDKNKNIYISDLINRRFSVWKIL